MREELGHHLLLVPADSQHHQQHRRHGRPELEDDPVPAGGLDPGLPGRHQGHPVIWEGTGGRWAAQKHMQTISPALYLPFTES